MENLKIGDVVRNISTGCSHVIEYIESFESRTYIYTEDRKCFPDFQVQKLPVSVCLENIVNILQTGDGSFENFKKIEKELNKVNLKLFEYNPPDIQEYIKSLSRS